MRTINPRPRAALVAAVLAAAAGFPGANPAAAKDAAVSPVARYLESVEVAPGVEHRLLIVHPILGRPAAEVRGQPAELLGGVASPDLVAIGQMEKSAKPKADVVTFSEDSAVFLTGDVLRTETADFAVAKDTVVPGGKPSQLPLVRISHELEPEPKSAEPAMLGEVLPSPLRFLLLGGATGPAVREAADRWAAEVKLETPRRSPVELPTADAIAVRVADYRKSLAKLPQPAAGADREVVGCAILVDGAFASIETFGTGKLFAAAWPKLLQGAAVEAAVEESREQLLATDLADPADPDRFLTDVKKRLLDVFGARLTESDVREEGKQFELNLDKAASNLLMLGEDRVTHFVLVTDPAHRGDKAPGEGPDPRAASRKARPTEEEQRLIDRRNGGLPVPTPPTPPQPPK